MSAVGLTPDQSRMLRAINQLELDGLHYTAFALLVIYHLHFAPRQRAIEQRAQTTAGAAGFAAPARVG